MRRESAAGGLGLAAASNGYVSAHLQRTSTGLAASSYCQHDTWSSGYALGDQNGAGNQNNREGDTDVRPIVRGPRVKIAVAEIFTACSRSIDVRGLAALHPRLFNRRYTT